MGTTVRVWQIDRTKAREVPSTMPETRRALIAEGTREIDLDQSVEGLGAVLEALGLDNLFEEDEVSARDVKRIAKTLEPLTFEKVEKLCATLGSPIEDPEYVGPYYEELRQLVLEASRAGRSLALETS